MCHGHRLELQVHAARREPEAGDGGAAGARGSGSARERSTKYTISASAPLAAATPKLTSERSA